MPVFRTMLATLEILDIMLHLHRTMRYADLEKIHIPNLTSSSTCNGVQRYVCCFFIQGAPRCAV